MARDTHSDNGTEHPGVQERAPLGPPADAEYLRSVLAEIDEEARARRSEIPLHVEREMDALFMEHAPLSGRHEELGAALAEVDRFAFIDPVVPVASRLPAGTAVKKGLRSMSLWYMGFVTHQVSRLGVAVAHALHAIDEQLDDVRTRVPPRPTIQVVGEGSAGVWWEGHALDALRGKTGRVLHAACGDGWLVEALRALEVDAYGIDPRPGAVDAAALCGADLRRDDPFEHLRGVRRHALGGVLLSGVVDGLDATHRDELVRLVCDGIAPHGVLVIHSTSPAGWASSDAPPEADLAAGRPLRATTWCHVLETWSTEVVTGGSGLDYLVIAHR